MNIRSLTKGLGAGKMLRAMERQVIELQDIARDQRIRDGQPNPNTMFVLGCAYELLFELDALRRREVRRRAFRRRLYRSLGPKIFVITLALNRLRLIGRFIYRISILVRKIMKEVVGDLHVKVVAGIPLTTRQLTDRKDVPSCSHTRTGNETYCSVCGRKFGTYNTLVRKSFVVVDDHEDVTIGGIQLHADNCDDYKITSGVVGFELSNFNDWDGGDRCGMMRLPVIDEEELEEHLDRLQAVLEPLGLWNEAQVGVYIIAAVGS